MPQGKRSTKQELGRWGEAYAGSYLEEKGYAILSQNFNTPYGEIDIVVQKEDRIIFVEVKTRSSQRFGFPEEAVTEEKISHLVESAEHYLQENPEITLDWQIDVIAIQVNTKKKSSPILVHFENALS